jgi:hypothetical protein
VKRLKDGQYWFKVSPVDPRVPRQLLEEVLGRVGGERRQVRRRAEAVRPRGQGHRKIPDFLIGLPFPKIDKNDPNAPARSRTTSTSPATPAAAAARRSR